VHGRDRIQSCQDLVLILWRTRWGGREKFSGGAPRCFGLSLVSWTLGSGGHVWTCLDAEEQVLTKCILSEGPARGELDIGWGRKLGKPVEKKRGKGSGRSRCIACTSIIDAKGGDG